KTLTKAGAAAGAKTVASAAAPVVLHATKPFFSTVIGKVVLGVVAAGVVAGGAAGYRWAKNNLFTKTGNILMADSSEDLRSDPTAPTLPVEIHVTNTEAPDVPVPTELSETEPAETEAPQPVNADIECGENLTWDFDPEESKLTITGSGAMYDYAAEEDAPWHRFRSEIHSVELPEGLTVIGKNTFAHCSMGEILIPDGVTVIGESAFSGCENLNIVNIPEGVTRIGDAAFLDCQSLNTSCSYAGGIKSKVDPACTLIFIPDSVEEIGARAFGYFDNPYKSFSIFGSENSAAERYAEENGLTFEPIVVVDEASIVAQLQKDQGVLGTEARLSYYKTVGDRCLAKVVHLDPITLTEEEIQAAKHNGVLTVDGKDYPFTDSWEDAGEMGFIQELSEQDPEPAGWISVDTGAKQPFMTPILRRDDGRYVIRDYDHADMYWNDHSFTSMGWIWLGIENVQSFQLEYAQKYGLARFLDTVDFQGVYHILELDGDGNIVISSRNGM
ncbi:MAG: leucine-rich repeat domain-containing protein, partial [Oscillospiraceae bacterium]|nr:leucine-rich repeat domain-containing protein [Oscillospiraceae bacterium]